MEGAPPGRYLAFGDGVEELLVPLRSQVTHIGRGLAADIRLDHPRVARLQAIVVQDADGARALDGRTGYGLVVNGRRVAATKLHDGDVMILGPVRARFVDVL